MKLLLANASPWMSGSPSSQLADRFGGVEFDFEDSLEDRRKGVHAFVSIFRLLEHMGWYEHTSDWDFHVAVELSTGRANPHIGDGASVAFITTRTSVGEVEEEFTYALDDERMFLQVSGPDVWDEEIERQGAEFDPLAEYRVRSAGDEVTWAFPIVVLRKVGFGYCT